MQENRADLVRVCCVFLYFSSFTYKEKDVFNEEGNPSQKLLQLSKS